MTTASFSQGSSPLFPSSLAPDFLESLLDTCSDGFVLLDGEWCVVHASERASRRLATPRESLVDRTIWDVVPALIGTAIERSYRRAAAEQTLTHCVAPDLSEPGRWIEHRVHPVAGKLAVQWLDVTEREQALSDLREREQRLGLIIDTTPEFVGYLDTECRFQMVNRPFLTFFNLSSDRVVGRTMREILGDEAWKMIEPRMNKALKGEVVSYEGHALYSAKGMRHIHATYTPDLDLQGKVRGVLSVVRDISEKKRAESVLAHTVEELRQINEAAPVAIFVSHDPDCKHVTGNAMALSLLELQPSENVSGDLLRSVVDPAAFNLRRYLDVSGRELSADELPMLKALRLNTEVREQLVIIDLPSGKQRSFYGSAVPLRDAQGGVRGCVGAFVDVTARMTAENALRESEERLRLAVKASGIGYWTWNIDAGTCEFDEVCAWMLGTRTHPEIAEAFSQVEPEDVPSVKDQLEASMAGIRPYRAEFRVRSKSGECRWISSMGDVVRDANGRAIRMSGVNVDITDRKVAEESLKESDRRKDHFLATLAHELRNPLAPISNALQILPRVENDPTQVAYLRRMMERQVEQLKRLIDDLLDVSRISRGKIQLRREPTTMRDVIERASESVMPFVQDGKHDLVLELPAKMLMIDGDRGRLVQVFGNLIHNAAKYTPQGGNIWVSVIEDGDDIVVNVRDNGTGIPHEMLSTIFDAFTQVAENLNRAQGGIGIGLTLVKNIIEMHGGTVEAKSAGVGHGSDFVVRLPRLVSAPSQRDTKDVSPEVRRTPHTTPVRRRILVVDDLKPSADTLGMMLTSLGQDVCVVYEGRAALSAVQEFCPHIVISDIAMPEMDGYHFAELVSQCREEAPLLVALTGYGQQHDQARALEAGFNRHLVKPTTLNALRELLELEE